MNPRPDCLHPTRTVVIIDILLRNRAAMHTTIAAAAIWQFEASLSEANCFCVCVCGGGVGGKSAFATEKPFKTTRHSRVVNAGLTRWSFIAGRPPANSCYSDLTLLDDMTYKLNLQTILKAAYRK